MIDSIPVPSTRKHQLHTKITQADSRHHHSPPLPAVNHHLRLNLYFASTDNQTHILSQSLDLKNLHQITFITRHDRSPCKSSVIHPPHPPYNAHAKAHNPPPPRSSIQNDGVPIQMRESTEYVEVSIDQDVSMKWCRQKKQA